MAERPNAEPAPEEHHNVHLGDPDSKGRKITPWAWVPSVYFAQGLQYAIVVQLFAIIFFTMGVPQGTTLFWVGLLSFPWTIKPLWGPLVDKYGSKRGWTWVMQLAVGAAFVGAAVSLLIPGSEPIFGVPPFMLGCIIALGILAFGAATHDIACDGYYMLALSEKKQAFYVGVRSTLFRAALIFANGILIWIAGLVQAGTGLPAVEAELNVTPQPESVEMAKVPSIESVFATERWPSASEQGILLMPSVLETTAGDTGYVTVRLAQSPAEGESETVVLRLLEADKGISVPKASTRIEFTQENWHTGVDVPISSDERLRTDVGDTLRAQAGNIPFSWSVVVLICAAVFLVAAIWHRFILPYPKGDAADATDRPPFIVPLSCLVATVGVPFLLCWAFMWGAGQAKSSLQEAVIGEVDSPALQDLREFVAPREGDPTVTAGQVMGVIDAMREEKIARNAGNLKSVVSLRKTLRTKGVLGEDETAERLFAFLEAQREDPDLYGNASLKQIVKQVEALNDGTLPEKESEVKEILSRASNSELDELPEDSDDLLAAVSSVETAFAALMEDQVDEEAEFAGGLPQTRMQLDQIISKAKETPSKLAVKGFSSFFTVARLILLLVIMTILIKVPVFWNPLKSAIYMMSDTSRIGFADVFATFFQKTGMAVTLGFLLTFRLGEAQLAQVKNLFLLDDRASSGLAMSLGEVAFTNSVVYLGALTVGGLLGGFLIARFGLKAVIWFMVASMHLPNLLYYYLSTTQPTGLAPVNFVVAVESFGYGFGFTAYLMIMILAAQGSFKTAHYALCTGAMALGYMIPGMWAGYLQELVGYNTFFLLVMVFTLPGTILIPFLKIDPSFGRKE